MITEKGTIKATTALDDKMQKEMSQTSHRIALSFLIIGAAGVFLFAVFQIVSFFIDFDDEGYFFILIFFALFLAMGFYLQFVLGKTEENVRAANKVSCCEFFKDYFLVTETVDGKTVSNTKVYNDRIIKVKQTKNYLFLYIDKASAYPIARSELSQTELNTLRAAFGLESGGDTVELPSQGE